jgi:hypothetical protein
VEMEYAAYLRMRHDRHPCEDDRLENAKGLPNFR